MRLIGKYLLNPESICLIPLKHENVCLKILNLTHFKFRPTLSKITEKWFSKLSSVQVDKRTTILAKRD